MLDSELEYVGFWPRVGATLLDTMIIWMVTTPFLVAAYGRHWAMSLNKPLISGPADFFWSWIFPAIATILLWHYRQATPGKMAISARVVDAETGFPLTLEQAAGRYLAYFVSILPLCLGLIWVAFDPKHQAWHDKLAGTVVVRSKHRGPQAVKFGGGV
jgi:uncharacterized RDD family membrane protein YckC